MTESSTLSVKILQGFLGQERTVFWAITTCILEFLGQLHLIRISTKTMQSWNCSVIIVCYFYLSWMYGFFLSVSSCYCYSLHVIRPAGIPVVPVYEEDEPSARRKVQRITSPEKWEIKQVNHCVLTASTLISYPNKVTLNIFFFF